MKIGIVTFHNAHNYGAILQSIALKNAITNLGHNVQIVDYHNEINDAFYRTNWRSIISGLKSNLLSSRYIIQRTMLCLAKERRYKIFQKNILKYCKPIKLSDLNPEILVFGSDQIWNEAITGKDLTYYGEISAYPDVKKISYAASLGFGSEQSLKNNKNLLLDFKAIGVREQSLQDSLQHIGIKSELNADPTLLLSAAEWDDIFDLKDEPKGDYLFVYAIRNRKRVIELAQRICTNNNLKVIELFSFEYFPNSPKLNKNSYASVRDFVRLLRNAKAVITDSFHGTVFSIIYGKPFISAKLGNKGDDRLYSILKLLNLESHFNEPELFDSNWMEEINDSSIEKLDGLRQKSLSYLKKSLI